MEVRRQHDPAQVGPCPPARGGLRHQPRKPDQLLIQLLRDRPRRSLRLLDRPQRHRDVWPVCVVLRIRDLPARRQEEREQEAAGERGAECGAEQPSQPRHRPAAHRERDDQPGGQRAQEDQQQELAQVRRHPVARLRTHRPHVRQLAFRNPLGRLAVDRPHVDREPGRDANSREARPPVDERHIDVKRALVERLDGQLDPAHAQVALGAVGREREQAPSQCGDHHKGHRGGAADGPHHPETSAGTEGGYS